MPGEQGRADMRFADEGRGPTEPSAGIGWVSLVPVLVGFAAMALLTAAYLAAPGLYQEALKLLMGNPYDHPFIDSEFMYAMKLCWQQGVDVYRSVPCDIVPGNRMAYSPLWQRLPFLPTDKEAYRVPVGLATDLLLILSLLVMPRARTTREAVLLSLALLSPMAVFALERNNIDVWMFLLIAAAILLLAHGTAARLAAYGLILAAGLLKYYPFALFLLALRERPRNLVMIGIAASAALAAFVWWFLPELRASFANIPAPSPVGNGWSILDGPRVAALIFTGEPDGESSTVLVTALRVLLTAFLVAGAIRRAGDPAFGEALAGMPARSRDWLVAGCIVVAGCYFAGPNLNYRGIYLLPVVAGLVAFAAAAPEEALRARIRLWTTLVVVVMWMPFVERAPETIARITGFQTFAMPAHWTFWLIRELLWCGLARFLLAIVIREALASHSGRWLLGLARPSRPSHLGATLAPAPVSRGQRPD
jgi:hypothetical protein